MSWCGSEDQSKIGRAVSVAKSSGTVVIAIGTSLKKPDGSPFIQEGSDALSISLTAAQTALVEQVAAAAKLPVVVLVHSATPLDLSAVLANPKVGAVMHVRSALQPARCEMLAGAGPDCEPPTASLNPSLSVRPDLRGQVGVPSTTIAGVGPLLYGDVSPAGRTVQTFYAKPYADQVRPARWRPTTPAVGSALTSCDSIGSAGLDIRLQHAARPIPLRPAGLHLKWELWLPSRHQPWPDPPVFHRHTSRVLRLWCAAPLSVFPALLSLLLLPFVYPDASPTKRPAGLPSSRPFTLRPPCPSQAFRTRHSTTARTPLPVRSRWRRSVPCLPPPTPLAAPSLPRPTSTSWPALHRSSATSSMVSPTIRPTLCQRCSCRELR